MLKNLPKVQELIAKAEPELKPRSNFRPISQPPSTTTTTNQGFYLNVINKELFDLQAIPFTNSDSGSHHRICPDQKQTQKVFFHHPQGSLCPNSVESLDNMQLFLLGYSSYSLSTSYSESSSRSGATSFSCLRSHKALHILGLSNLFWTSAPEAKALHTPHPPEPTPGGMIKQAPSRDAIFILKLRFYWICCEFFPILRIWVRKSQKGRDDWQHSPLATSSNYQGLTWLWPHYHESGATCI